MGTSSWGDCCISHRFIALYSLCAAAVASTKSKVMMYLSLSEALISRIEELENQSIDERNTPASRMCNGKLHILIK